MYAIMPQTPPTFSFGRPGQSHNHDHQHQHRPTFSSPLSSSPIRASSVSPPPPHDPNQPLSPFTPNLLNSLPRQQQQQQQCHPQSSPTPASSIFFNSSNSDQNQNQNQNNSKFRFASRNPRPNPVVKRREDAQEGRRRLFFQNVRQRREEGKWEARGGEDELLKLEWHRLNRERQQAKEAEAAQYLGGALTDDDADEAALEEEELRTMQQYARRHQDMDALMADAIAQQEQADVDALVSALEEDAAWQGYGQDELQQQQQQFSDDEDYDGLFMDLIQQQQQQHQGGQGMGDEQDVEMS